MACCGLLWLDVTRQVAAQLMWEQSGNGAIDGNSTGNETNGTNGTNGTAGGGAAAALERQIVWYVIIISSFLIVSSFLHLSLSRARYLDVLPLSLAYSCTHALSLALCTLFRNVCAPFLSHCVSRSLTNVHE